MIGSNFGLRRTEEKKVEISGSMIKHNSKLTISMLVYAQMEENKKAVEKLQKNREKKKMSPDINCFNNFCTNASCVVWGN